jgi:hypothetical protein
VCGGEGAVFAYCENGNDITFVASVRLLGRKVTSLVHSESNLPNLTVD